jgi:hypothetical protein
MKNLEDVLTGEERLEWFSNNSRAVLRAVNERMDLRV